jgi:hypothetical protein
MLVKLAGKRKKADQKCDRSLDGVEKDLRNLDAVN